MIRTGEITLTIRVAVGDIDLEIRKLRFTQSGKSLHADVYTALTKDAIEILRDFETVIEGGHDA